MSILNIFSLDDVDFKDLIVSLSKGSHIIGRGDLLDVTDKRVSRNHAQLDVADDIVTLTSTHQNPCFIRASQSSNLTILKQNDQIQLSDEDHFALLPDKYWFTVKINKGSVEGNNISGKRHLESDIDTVLNVNSKKIKTESDSNINDHYNLITSKTEITQCNLESVANKNITVFTDIQNNEAQNTSVKTTENKLDLLSENVKSEPDQSNLNSEINEDLLLGPDDTNETPSLMKTEPDRSDLDSKTGSCENIVKCERDCEQTSSSGIAQSNDAGLEDNTKDVTVNTASSSEKKVREKCWYGEGCFRKNPTHKQLYSHPGDDDYVPNTQSDIPDCPFGASCYRKNVAHRQQYRHPTKKPKNQRRKKKARVLPDSNETPEDDYDFEDPFINDGSSDDFEPSDYDEDYDSDWDESGEIEKELEERKRLLREAKKFTKPH